MLKTIYFFLVIFSCTNQFFFRKLHCLCPVQVHWLLIQFSRRLFAALKIFSFHFTKLSHYLSFYASVELHHLERVFYFRLDRVYGKNPRRYFHINFLSFCYTFANLLFFSHSFFPSFSYFFNTNSTWAQSGGSKIVFLRIPV